MRWMLALFLASTVALPARADEIIPYCRSESAEREPLARLIVDLDAANARLHPPRHPHPDPRVHVTFAIVAKRIEDFCDGHPRSAEPPDVVRIWTDVTFNPIVMVAPKASVLRDVSYEQYVGFREADAAYHRWTESVGEKVGSQYGPRWTTGAKVATQTQLLLDTLALGPDLVLLPEAVLQTPWRLGNGLIESFCGGLQLDAKRALLGVAEYEGALGTLATAGLLANAVHDYVDPPDDASPKPIGTPAGNFVARTPAEIKALIDELVRQGKKVTPGDVRAIQRIDGRIVWLEEGVTREQAAALGRRGPSGLAHILEDHGAELAAKGIPPDAIPDLVMEAIANGRIVGFQGDGATRPIYEYTFGGETFRSAITISDNGYVVGMNMQSSPRP